MNTHIRACTYPANRALPWLPMVTARQAGELVFFLSLFSPVLFPLHYYYGPGDPYCMRMDDECMYVCRYACTYGCK